MDGSTLPAVTIRHATPADVDALASLRPPRGIHADRLPQETECHYCLAEVNRRPVGFGVVYFRGDPMWDRPEQVPLVMDLWVIPELRGRGIGSRMLEALEASARERGFQCVYVQVQAERNPRALELYRRLGYQTLQSKPYVDLYHHVDELGNVHEGTEMIVDMQKWL